MDSLGAQAETDWLPSPLPLLHLHILIHRGLFVNLGFRGGFDGGNGAIPGMLCLWDHSQVLHRLHVRITGATVKTADHTLVQVRRQGYSTRPGRTKPDFDSRLGQMQKVLA